MVGLFIFILGLIFIAFDVRIIMNFATGGKIFKNDAAKIPKLLIIVLFILGVPLCCIGLKMFIGM